MSKDKKSNKLKALISSLFGINEWKLKADGHLDMNPEDLTKLTEEYGVDFVAKFEKLLSEENSDNNSNQNQTNMPKDLKLALICALLSVDALQMSDDGNVVLNQEQLGKIEAGLKKLQDEKESAETNLTAANTAKDTAVNSLSDAVKAMDELDPKVKEAKDPAAKVEAIRVKLAEKPAVNNNGGALATDPVTEGKDEVNAFAKQFKS